MAENTGIKKSIAMVGSRLEFAKKCNVNPMAVQRWEEGGSFKIKYLKSILAATDYQVSIEEIAPELLLLKNNRKVKWYNTNK